MRLASDEGALRAHVASHDEKGRDGLGRHLRTAYLIGRPGGRSYIGVALSCRGGRVTLK